MSVKGVEDRVRFSRDSAHRDLVRLIEGMRARNVSAADAKLLSSRIDFALDLIEMWGLDEEARAKRKRGPKPQAVGRYDSR